ncbi:MAG: M14 family zinc carboxypeptidase [bacterium]|nr:M14 family zinc carboxypeptidase [bacterium]
MRRLMFSLTVLFIAMMICSPLPAQEVEKYHLILIPNPSPETIQRLGELGLALDDAHAVKNQGIEIPVSDSDLNLVRSHGLNFRLIQEDLAGYYEKICLENLHTVLPLVDTDPVHMKYGSMGGFYTFQQITSDLDSMRLLYPNLCTAKVILGNGWNNNPIYMVKISDNPDIDENEPEAIFDALHHAREPGGYTATLYAMWYLLENYGTDAEVTYLVNNREFYFVPVTNPDGLLYNQQTNPNGGGTWRKNRRNNGGSYGVDLNRNYSYQWGYDNIGSSPTPSSETYRGPSAASEPETQAMINFTNVRHFATGMTCHTSGNVYLTAYGYANVMPEYYDVHMDYMGYAAQQNGYDFGPSYVVEYASNGRTQDWQLHEHDIINIEPEIGSHGFWPSISYIMPEARDNLNCFLNQFWCAGGQVLFSSLDVVDGYLTPGQTENLICTVFNRGWGTSEAVNYQLSSIDPYITITTSTASTDTLRRRSTAGNSANPFIVEVASNCPIGHIAQFTVSINQGGFIRTQNVNLTVGQPTVFFQDNAETGMSNWTTTGTWGLCNTNPHAGTYSFADSPSGNYGNNANMTMTLTQPLNLSGSTTLWLEYWARWNIEANYDFCQIEVSTNGSTWTPLAGQYTQSGAGQGQQPLNEPGYEGTQSTWVHETINLTPYVEQSYLKFRFEFKSDGGVVADGFFVDDLKLMGFTGSVPPTLDINISAINPPIVIPANGGNFQYNINVHNLSTSQQNFQVWNKIRSGSIYYTVFGPVSRSLPGNANPSRTLTQNVASTIPAGTNYYISYIGPNTSTIVDSSYFTFTKSTSADGGPWLSESKCSGEFLEEYASVEIPTTACLVQVSPNPFNPTTLISYELPNSSLVKLTVYDISGREVVQLVDGWCEVGSHQVTFDATRFASGVYLYRLTTSGSGVAATTITGKMVLLK